MDFKIQIKCGKCRCKFEIRPGFLEDDDRISCPCCSTAIPDDITKDIIAGTARLGRIPDQITSDGKSKDFLAPSDAAFSFTIVPFSETLDIMKPSS